LETKKEKKKKKERQHIASLAKAYGATGVKSTSPAAKMGKWLVFVLQYYFHFNLTVSFQEM